MAELYPIFLNLEGKPCLVVGGGSVATRKVKGLLEAGAQITVIAPQADPEIKTLAESGKVFLIERPFQGEVVVGQWLVFSATNDAAVNEAVFKACEKAGVPANVADNPPLCRFQVPSRYIEGPLQIAVSTKGESPGFCQRLSRELGRVVTPWAPRLAEWLGDLRDRLKEVKPENPTWRKDILQYLLDSHIKKMKTYATEDNREAFESLVEKVLRGVKER